MKGKENTQGKCRRCQKTIEFSNMSIQALRSRAAGNKHLEITHKISCFFKKSRTVEKEGNNKAASFAEKGPKKCTQTSVELTFASSEEQMLKSDGQYSQRKPKHSKHQYPLSSYVSRMQNYQAVFFRCR